MASGRPLEWMRFDPVRFGMMVDGMDLAEEGTMIRVVRHLWQRGPLTEVEMKRLCRSHFDAVRPAMVEVDGKLTLDMVEEARNHGQRVVTQRSEAGKASALKRYGGSTVVEHEHNEHPSDVLSKSLSISQSPSESLFSGTLKKERVHEFEVWPTFDDWWKLYAKPTDKKKCAAKWVRITQSDRERMMAHTEVYVTKGQGVERQYRRNPETYINNENWNDDGLLIPRSNGTQQPTSADRQRSILEHIAAEHGGAFAPNNS